MCLILGLVVLNLGLVVLISVLVVLILGLVVLILGLCKNSRYLASDAPDNSTYRTKVNGRENGELIMNVFITIRVIE